jgi:pimeloyl-ACP methyl ester carboxylesterase
MRRRPSASATDEEDDHPLPNASDRPPDDDDDDNDDDRSSPDASPDSLIAPLDRPHHKSKRKNGRPVDQAQNNLSRQQPPPWPSSAKPGIHGKPLARKPSGAGLAPVDPRRDVTMAHRARLRSPWSFTWLSLLALLTSVVLLLSWYHSFLTRQLDPKGGSMSYMASSFVRFDDFDTEHTRFASKYTIHLYRELGVDEDPRVKGVPVLFIPGNAGSYKQVRSLASEAEYSFQQLSENMPQHNNGAKLGLDFFTVDFNEDFTAFHGQTLVDQAEYLNDAIAYILALYHNPDKSRRDSGLPDPSSVILIGHSMGGVVARTMLTLPNYQTNSVNTIITLSAPHARPPVTFDAQIVDTYKSINEYWRRAHSKKWGMDNPLWHVTVISIAGGGLDTIVPSDYASVSSLVPETHGFTVFTSTIPTVWTGMDHLAITWCDEFRKVVIKALFDVMDARRPAQTKPRGERMRDFKKWFLTGLEDIAERSLPNIGMLALARETFANGTRLEHLAHAGGPVQQSPCARREACHPSFGPQ